METHAPTNAIVVKYVLTQSSDIALDCDNWTPIDFAGAIDSGLLRYEGWQPASAGSHEPANDTVTVLITVNASSENALSEESIRHGLIDAFENYACMIESHENHIVHITVSGTIADGHIHDAVDSDPPL